MQPPKVGDPSTSPPQIALRRRKFVLPTIVVAAVVAVAVGGATIVMGQKLSENVVKLFGGNDGLQTVLAPERVEAYRVAARTANDDESGQIIGGAKILSGSVAVDSETARALSDILKDPHTYGWDFAKGCKFDPGVAVRFTAGASTVDVILCFHCEELQVYLNEQNVGGEDFDAATAKLAAIVKRIFPDDEEIQKL
jgi:hypothetical protein